MRTTKVTNSLKTLIPNTIYFHDCTIKISTMVGNIQKQQKPLETYQWIKKKMRRRKRLNIELKGEFSQIAGTGRKGFNNTLIESAEFFYPWLLKYQQGSNKLFISEDGNHIMRSISNISINQNDGKWNGELKIEVGQPEKQGYCNGDRSTCRLRYPSGFDWNMNDNMYICNETCICKVDVKSNQVSLVAGHETDEGYKDGNNDEARFHWLHGMVCSQQQIHHHHHQSPLVLYVCDARNHCIRMIDFTNGKTTTFTGKGKEDGDVDGTLQSARFSNPWDIVKDDENDHILYVSDSGNCKIKMIDMKKGMVTILVGDASILCYPQQMQMIDPFIYVTCSELQYCIVRIDKHCKQVARIKFNDGKQAAGPLLGITYHELDQCFYISDYYNIYRLE